MRWVAPASNASNENAEHSFNWQINLKCNKCGIAIVSVFWLYRIPSECICMTTTMSAGIYACISLYSRLFRWFITHDCAAYILYTFVSFKLYIMRCWPSRSPLSCSHCAQLALNEAYTPKRIHWSTAATYVDALITLPMWSRMISHRINSKIWSVFFSNFYENLFL